MLVAASGENGHANTSRIKTPLGEKLTGATPFQSGVLEQSFMYAGSLQFVIWAVALSGVYIPKYRRAEERGLPATPLPLCLLRQPNVLPDTCPDNAVYIHIYYTIKLHSAHLWVMLSPS